MSKRVTTTIGTRLDEHKGIGPGFDFLRVFLAFSVVAFHTAIVIGHELANEPFLWFTQYWVLAIFFSLSGFLIAGSATRLSLGNFLINRGLRILPALAVEVLLSAFLLGPAFTTLPPAIYYTRFETYQYMSNMVGLIHYTLPGVFKDNPNTLVNASLWTVPFEVGCYAIISFLIYYKLLSRANWLIAAALLFSVLGILLAGANALQIIHIDSSYTLQKLYAFFCDRGSRLLVTFTLGIAAYLYRYRIRYDSRIFFLCLLVCVAVSAVNPSWTKGEYSLLFPTLNLLVAAPLTYIMAFLGVSRLPTLPLFHRGDYSYGIYLYGFPIQQAIIQLVGSSSYLVNLALEILPITLLAVFSWHMIEKPIMKLRKRFSFVARQRLAQAV